MSFSFENQGINTYLVYTIGKEDEIDSMSLGMLTNNKIPGLAPAIFQQMDTTKYIKFNISAKVSVNQFFTGAVNRKRLLGVFSGIVNAMLSAEEYMIDTNSILLDLDYIYADVSTCDTVLICLPIALEKEPVELGTFFRNIVFRTQFDQTENCDYVARLINYLNSMPVFSLLDFKEILAELNQGSLSAKQEIHTGKTQEQVQTMPVQKGRQTISSAQPAVGSVHSVQQIGSQERLSENPVQVISQMQALSQSQQSNMRIPSSENTNTKQEQHSGEKQISAMYLMMHYSKENKQKYKEQKEQKKMQQSAVSKSGSNGKVQKGKKKKEKSAPSEFAVPNTNGQPQSFAIPGQSTPVIQPQSPSIPQSTPLPESELVQQTLQNASSQSSHVVQNFQNVPQPQIKTGTANFGETTVLGADSIGETTVLNAAQQTEYRPKPYLIRTKNNEKIPLDKPVFRIGKEKSYVDYFIGDNTAISRSHANIITKGGEYFVVDTNSTNHTYVNGAMIQSNAETKISGGSRICLANEEFEFKLL